MCQEYPSLHLIGQNWVIDPSQKNTDKGKGTWDTKISLD